jgi:acyl-CoA hydrolase
LGAAAKTNPTNVSIAIRRAKSRVATFAVTSMTFRKPVFVDDEETFYAENIKIGTTSITVRIESWVPRGIGGEAAKSIRRSVRRYQCRAAAIATYTASL